MIDWESMEARAWNHYALVSRPRPWSLMVERVRRRRKWVHVFDVPSFVVTCALGGMP